MHISISTPCHEDWNSMTPIAKGRHCAACSKTVLDLTQMSEVEVVKTLRDAQPKGGVCTRIKTSNLNRYLQVPRAANTSYTPLRAGLAAVAIAGMSLGLQAQTNEYPSSLIGNEGVIVTGYRVDPMSIDETSQGLTITQHRNKLLHLPKRLWTKVSRRLNYELLEKPKIRKEARRARLETADRGAEVEPLTKPAATVAEQLLFYPNPSNGEVTLVVPTDFVLLNVYAASGSLVLAQAVDLEAKETMLSLPTSHPAGSYFVQAIDATGAVVTQQTWIVVR